MKNLLKADFFRLFKDKSALVGLIITAALSVISVVFLYLVFEFLMEIPEGTPGIPIYTGEVMMKSAFQASNNAGMILAIIIGMIATKDFSHNTVRQKTIYGHKRTNIYLSQLITVVVYAAVVMVINAVISLVLGSIFFGYTTSGFVVNDILYILYALGMGILLYIVMASLVMMIAFLTKSTGLTVVISIGLSFFITIIFTILMYTGGANDIVKFFMNLMPDQHFLWYLNSRWMSLEQLAYSIGASLGYILLFTLIGIKSFNKTDIK